MTKQATIRNKLDSKVFNVIGKTVTLNSKSSPTYNIRGEEEDATITSSSIVIVPYNIMFREQSYEAFGDIESGEKDAAVRYDVDINIDDYLEIESENWIVKAIEKNYLPDNVVTIVRLSRSQV